MTASIKHHPSPYELLRAANGLHPTATGDATAPAWSDAHTLAARWEDLRQPPPEAGAPRRPESPAAGPAPPPVPDTPADGPRMRTPAPMHPPIAYPNATQTYGAPAAPPKPRHPYYDAIIEQHKSAAEKAVFVPAALE